MSGAQRLHAVRGCGIELYIFFFNATVLIYFFPSTNHCPECSACLLNYESFVVLSTMPCNGRSVSVWEGVTGAARA